MNTPSHHRVHHARNPKYLDKNYAGMFIIWDRLFGTFQLEEEQPVYGITKPLHSWNPLWANLHSWAELAHDAWHAPRWPDKIKIWFMPLGWTPPGMPERPRAQEVTRASVKKYDPHTPWVLSVYVFAQLLVVLALGVVVLLLGEDHVPLRVDCAVGSVHFVVAGEHGGDHGAQGVGFCRRDRAPRGASLGRDAS